MGEAEIFAACERGDLAQIRLLLHSKNVNIRNQQGNTPLALVARQGSLPATRFLLTLGANSNAVNEVNFTQASQSVLFQAANLGQANIIRELIDHGADVEAEDRVSAIDSGAGQRS